jgi:hypothetical protein
MAHMWHPGLKGLNEVVTEDVCSRTCITLQAATGCCTSLNRTCWTAQHVVDAASKTQRDVQVPGLAAGGVPAARTSSTPAGFNTTHKVDGDRPFC